MTKSISRLLIPIQVAYAAAAYGYKKPLFIRVLLICAKIVFYILNFTLVGIQLQLCRIKVGKEHRAFNIVCEDVNKVT
jgi:hypothetical protein